MSDYDDYDDWNDYDESTSANINNKSVKNESSSYDDYPHLFLNLGKQKFYTPFLFYRHDKQYYLSILVMVV